MSKLLRAFLTLAFLFTPALVARAGVTSGGVRGLVLDTAGQPIAGAQVAMASKEFGTKFSFTTDKKGVFMQMGMKNGDYEVSVSAAGYASTSGTLHITLEARTPFEVRLQRAAQDGSGAAGGEATTTTAYKFGDEVLSAAAGKALAAAQAANQAGHADEAKAGLEALLKLEPGAAAAHFMLADLYREGGDTARAIAETKAGLDSQPGYAPGWVALGELAQKAGQTDDAVAAYRKAVEADGTQAATWKKLGMALLEQGNLADSAKALAKYLELKPEASDKDRIQTMIDETTKILAAGKK